MRKGGKSHLLAFLLGVEPLQHPCEKQKTTQPPPCVSGKALSSFKNNDIIVITKTDETDAVVVMNVDKYIPYSRKFRKVQFFSYFEHTQIVRKIEPRKFFLEITRFFLTRQLFVYYGAPDVPVNMVASYHHLDGERSMQHEWKSLN